jgi:hypothetical protein
LAAGAVFFAACFLVYIASHGVRRPLPSSIMHLAEAGTGSPPFAGRARRPNIVNTAVARFSALSPVAAQPLASRGRSAYLWTAPGSESRSEATMTWRIVLCVVALIAAQPAAAQAPQCRLYKVQASSLNISKEPRGDAAYIDVLDNADVVCVRRCRRC